MPRPRAWLHRPTVFVLKLLAFILRYRVAVRGQENIPKSGGFVLAPNHLCYLDPPVVVCTMPRPVYFMAKKKLFRAFFGLLGKYFAESGVFAIDPDDRASVSSALRLSVEIVRQGRGICIYPQGTRMPPGHINMEDVHGGMAYVASKGDVPIIPMLMCYQKWGVEVAFGPAVVGGDRDSLIKKAVGAINSLYDNAMGHTNRGRG